MFTIRTEGKETKLTSDKYTVWVSKLKAAGFESALGAEGTIWTGFIDKKKYKFTVTFEG